MSNLQESMVFQPESSVQIPLEQRMSHAHPSAGGMLVPSDRFPLVSAATLASEFAPSDRFEGELLALKSKTAEFLEQKRGKKIIKRSVVAHEPIAVPVPRSWINGFGLLWYVGVARYQPGKRIVRKTIEQQVERRPEESVPELHQIIDAYIETYRNYATHIEGLVNNQLSTMFRDTKATKKSYFAEIVAAKDRAVLHASRRSELIALHGEKKNQLAREDPFSRDAMMFETELDDINLQITQYTHSGISAIKELQVKREHASLLKCVEYGIYVLSLTAETTAKTVHELVRQLDQTREFSALSLQVIDQLGVLGDKLNEGSPYMKKSGDLLRSLLGLTFGIPLGGTAETDPSRIMNSIKRFEEKSQENYQSTMQLLEQFRGESAQKAIGGKGNGSSPHDSL